MNDRTKSWVAVAVVGASVLLVSRVRAVGNLVHFSAGDPVSAADFNSNFDTLHGAIEDLEGELVTLQADLTEARSAAGYLTAPDGATMPYYRKVIQATKASTSTTIAHGVSGSPATERRFVSCQVVTNYATDKQDIPYNTTDGASGLFWCDLDDTNVSITWATATSMPYQVVLEYVKTPLD